MTKPELTWTNLTYSVATWPNQTLLVITRITCPNLC